MTLIQWPALSLSQEDLQEPTLEERPGAEAPRTAAGRRARPRSADGRQPPAAPTGLKTSASAAALSAPYTSAEAVPWAGPERRRLEPVPEADADSPGGRDPKRGPLTLVLPLSAEQVQPEMLVETVRSSASSGTGRALSGASGGGSGVAAPRSQKLPLDLMVLRPAGSAAKEAAAGQAPPSPQHWQQRCRELEQELSMLRTRYEEELERQREAWRERLQEAEEEAQRRLKALESDRDQTRDEAVGKLQDAQQKLKAEERKSSAADVLLRELRSELAEQAEAVESASSWKREAQSHAASLSAAERRCEGHAERVAKARRHAAEVERQRKELVRNTSVQASQKLREELEQAQSERSELEKRLKKALPRIERLTAEDQRLRARLHQEAEAAAAQAQSMKEESLELSRAKDQLQKQRRQARSEAEQCEALQSQLNEAEQQRRAAQVELAKSQRLRQEEQKRRQSGFSAEREGMRREIEQLTERLRHAEVGVGPAVMFAMPPKQPAQASRQPSASVSLLASKQSAMSERWVDDDGTEAGSIAAGATNSKVAPNDAGVRLFEMIQLAKERADQRRHLTDATEEVREQARALEELLTHEHVSMTHVANVGLAS
mmetsp:Transcript_58635/g.137289  ORF Transcript_58635/g.137289 Transcript_58635/m.137289 type:complete len:606 (+) Transcript_58635:56-1873(+)